MTFEQYDYYLFSVEMAFTKREDSGFMPYEKYYRLAKKLDEWNVKYRILLGEEETE